MIADFNLQSPRLYMGDNHIFAVTRVNNYIIPVFIYLICLPNVIIWGIAYAFYDHARTG